MTTTIEYALMAGHAYRTTRDEINWLPVPQGWTPFFPVPDSTTPIYPTTGGFEAVSFTNGANIIISYAGTYPLSLGDLAADLELANGIISNQLIQAAEYYLRVKNDPANAGKTISFTGHSLGGGLAALLGVFFGKEAVTFDQAPFATAATQSLIGAQGAATLKDCLIAVGYSEAALSELTNFIQLQQADGGIPNSNLVSDFTVQGEFLSSIPPFSWYSKIGTSQPLLHGTPELDPIDLHLQDLLATFELNDQFRQVTFKLPDLERLMFDGNLYNNSTASGSESFITRLVRHQVGGVGDVPVGGDTMLERFTTDLEKIAQDGGLTMSDAMITKAMMAFAMQKYYGEQAGGIGVGETLFKNVTGGVQFDTTAIAADITTAKGYEQYFQNFLNIPRFFTDEESTLIKSMLPQLRDWYVQAGASGMTATDASTGSAQANRGAFMLGGNGADTLTGGTKADLLVGNAGDDVLNGGQGSDTLLGGIGVDTYVLNTGAGQGIDTVLDSDQKGYLRDDTTSPIVLSGGEQYGDNKVFRGTDANGVSHLYTFVTGDRSTGGDLIVDGAMLIKDYKPSLGNGMGISFADATPYQAPQPITQPQTPTPVMPTATRDIIGDAQKAKFTNTLAAGTVIDPTWKWDILHVQENAHDENRTDANGNPYTVRIVDSHTYTYNQRDDLDNWILDQTQPDPTRADILNDGSGNDRILAGGGYNTIYATHGGDNLIEAGDGGNTITAGSGNDSIITGSGNDSINAGAGDNTIAAGDGYNTITSGTGNDIIEGGANSDSIDAGAGDNTILAADGNNTLISGKGNDTILTGKDVDTINAGEGNNYINAGDGINTVTTGDGNDTLLTGKDNDIIHAGSGDNYVDAGAGRDIVDASATGLTPGVDPTQAKSILIGGADADILTGGAGEDKLYADSAIDTALAIAQGETQTGLTDQGDWLAGGAGDGRMRRRIRAANDAKHAIPPEWRIAA